MNKTFDAVILGGGINGCGIARHLAEQGKKIALLERSTIGSGTSSNSSKLIHGGLRYLENLAFSLVKEALKDRARLCREFPELVKIAPFYLPIYEDSPRSARLIRFGLKIYELFSGKEYRSQHIDLAEFAKEFPNISTRGLLKVFQYSDAVTDDLALTRAVAEKAAAAGVHIAEHTSPTAIRKAGGLQIEVAGQHLETPLLINATGPWIDEVNHRFELPAKYQISKVSGLHLVIGQVLAPHPLFLQTSGNRIFFIIPKADHTLIGTTERVETALCDEVSPSEEDIEYLLANANRYLTFTLARKDIQEVTLGIRPLIESKDDPSKSSREYRFDLQEGEGWRILHIFGGKLTTFPSLAEKAGRLLFPQA